MRALIVDLKLYQDNKKNNLITALDSSLSIIQSKYSNIINHIHIAGVCRIDISIQHRPLRSRTRFGFWIEELQRQGLLVYCLKASLAQSLNYHDDSFTNTSNLDNRLILKPGDESSFLGAFEDLLEALSHGRSDILFRHLIRAPNPGDTTYIEDHDIIGSTRPVPVGSSIICTLFCPSSFACLSHIDTSLIACTDEEATAIGQLLAEVVSPFLCDDIVKAFNQQHVRLKSICIPSLLKPSSHDVISGGQLNLKQWPECAPSYQKDATAIGWNINRADHDKSAADQVAAIVLKSTFQNLFRDSKLSPERLKIQIVGGQPSFEDSILNILSSLEIAPSYRDMEDNLNVEVFLLLPGAAPFTCPPRKNIIVIDLFGATDWRPKPDLLVNNIIYIRGARLRVGGTIIPTLASFPAGHVEPELVARLLDTLNQDSVTLVALMGFWGEIGPKDWQAFRRRLEEKIGWVPPVEAIAATPTLFEPPVDDFNLCDVVFSKQNLDSSAEIVAPSLNQKMTYAELMREVQTIASYLHESGARPGHIIGVAAPDDLCTSSIMLAALWIGCTFVPLNHHASPDNFASMLNSSKPDLIIYDIACVRPHGDSLAQSSSSKVELKVFKSSIRSHPIASKNAFNNPLPVSPNTGAVLLFTSGSTGRPKGVLHTHSDFVTCARNYGYFTVDITANDRVYSPSPSFFAYGINTALLTLLCGATYIIATPQKVLDTADILEHHRVSVLFAVPAVFKRLMLNKKSEHIYPALRLCISAGEKLPSRLSHEVSRRLGVPVLDGIGCTETISTFISNRISNNAPGTTGTVVPGFAVRLVNRKGEPCQIGEVGVLLVAGNTLVARYFEADSRANSQFQDGWFDTKDMFFMDTNHRFYCVGRSSSVIKINGCWFSPETIESVLQTHPLVDECGVGVIIDEFGLPRPKAFVVLRGETETKGLWKELGELSKAQLGKDHYPHLFQAVARLPRTPSGKLLRSALNTQTVC